MIELPVKLQILNASGGSITSTAACTIDQLVPKSGSWQFLDSVQVVIDDIFCRSQIPSQRSSQVAVIS
jgi:hypothetical protein